MLKVDKSLFLNEIDGVYIRQWNTAKDGVVLFRGEIDFNECNSIEQIITRLREVISHVKNLDSPKPTFLTLDREQDQTDLVKAHDIHTIHLSSNIILGNGDRRATVIISSYIPEDERPLYETEDEACKADGRIFRHYQRGIYQLLADNVKIWHYKDEPYVVYRHLWPHKPDLYARPSNMFYGQCGDKPRFTLIKDGPLATEIESPKAEGRIYHSKDYGIYQMIAEDVKHTEQQDELHMLYKQLWPGTQEMYLSPMNAFYSAIEKSHCKLLLNGPLLWDAKKK